MDPHTLKFLCFGLFSLASLALGYLARKRGWLHEDLSRPIHFHTVVWVWSAAAMFSLWQHPLAAPDLWFVLLQTVIVAALGFGIIPIARLFGCTREQTGVLAVAASVGNLGFTLGGYLCYSLIRPADAALTLAVAYVCIMQIVGILIIYPLARHYGRTDPGDMPLWRLMLVNLADLRSLPLYVALLGAALAWGGVPYPAAMTDYHLLDVIFYVGSFGGYFGIGLRLRTSHQPGDLKAHFLLAAAKFLFIPLITWAMLLLIQQTAHPLSDTARLVALVEAFMPTAIWTVMLANLFHLDVRLAGSLWFYNTLAFFVLIMPPMVWLLR